MAWSGQFLMIEGKMKDSEGKIEVLEVNLWCCEGILQTFEGFFYIPHQISYPKRKMGKLTSIPHLSIDLIVNLFSQHHLLRFK